MNVSSLMEYGLVVSKEVVGKGGLLLLRVWGARGQGGCRINYLLADAFSFMFPLWSKDFRFCALFWFCFLFFTSGLPFLYLSFPICPLKKEQERKVSGRVSFSSETLAVNNAAECPNWKQKW